MNRPKSIEVIRQRFHNSPLPMEGIEEVLLRDEPCEQSGNVDEATVPPQLAKLFAQRHAARAVTFRPIPQPGQILRICPLQRGKDSLLPCDEPLAVLLDRPLAEGKWRGWLVGHDPEYATVWDLILGPEEDPRDPQCVVVQIWNPVTITIAETDRVLAELSDERLAAARSMDNDCTKTVLPAPIHDTRMGVQLARELSDGTGVVTGTPLAAANDRRREYQEKYRAAGIWVSQGGLTSHTERGLSGVIQGGQMEEASLITRALALAMAVLSSGSVRQPWKEAHTYYSRGAVDKLTPEMEEAVFRYDLEKAERSQGIDHPDVAYLLMDLANCYEQQGRYTVAEPLYKRSLAIYEKVFAAGLPSGKDKLWIRNCARKIEQLAAIYQRQGRHADAESLFKRSLAIYEKVFGATDQNYVAGNPDNSGLTYNIQDRNAETSSQYAFRSVTDDRIDQDCVVDGLRHLALFYESQSRYAEAESQYDRLLSILENYYHSDAQVAEVLKNVAVLYQKQGRRAEAESLLKLSVEITEKAHNARRPIQPAPEPKSEPGPFDWLKRTFAGNDGDRWKPAAARLTAPWRFGLVLAFVIAAALVVISQAPRKPEFQVSIIRHSGGGAEFAIPGYRTVEVAVGSPVVMIKTRDAELAVSNIANQLKDSGGTVEVKRRDGEITINVAGVKKPSTTLFNLLGDEAAGLFKAPIVSIVIIQAR